MKRLLILLILILAMQVHGQEFDQSDYPVAEGITPTGVLFFWSIGGLVGLYLIWMLGAYVFKMRDISNNLRDILAELKKK